VSHITEGSRQANLLGTCAVAVAERVRAATDSPAVPGPSTPAALIALHTFLGGTTIDGLARVLHITHSGTVRLADRLEAAGLVERRAGADGRAVSLHLTTAGRRAARALQAEREAAIEHVLAPLDAHERQALTGLMEKLLGALAVDRPAARHLCRMCDVDACGHPDTCPVTQAVPH
jgi:DNA-binding MarR family transcriptional regulator